MTVRKVPKSEVLGSMQYGRILHGSSMQQYCYAWLGIELNLETNGTNNITCLGGNAYLLNFVACIMYVFLHIFPL